MSENNLLKIVIVKVKGFASLNAYFRVNTPAPM